MVLHPQVLYFSGYLIIAISVVAAFLGGMAGWRLSKKWWPHPPGDFIVFVGGTVAWVVIIAILSLYCPNVVGVGGGVIRDRAGKAILVVNHAGLMCLRVPGLTLIDLRPDQVRASGDFADISTNPKVRNIRINITFKPKWTVQAALERYTMMGDRASFETWAASSLNQFNEAYSKELAKLYDPYDLAQQSRFYGMVESFFLGENDPYRTGPPLIRDNIITLEDVKFDIVGSGTVTNQN